MESTNKNVILFVLGAMAAMGPFSVDMYLPGFPAIARDLHTDVGHVGLTLTAYFTGFSLGLLLSGPFFDRFGRKRPIVLGLAVYVVAAVGCALSPSIGYLIALRFFLALGSCVGMVGSSTVVRDLFKGNEVAKALSMMMTIFGVAPIVAPSLGGGVIAALGWRYIFVVLALFAAFVLLAISRVLRGARGPDASVSLDPRNIIVGYLQVFEERQFLVYALVIGASTGGLFSYITGSPFVFITLFGFTSTQYAWIFGANGLAMVLGSQLNRWLLKNYDSRQVLRSVIIVQSLLALSLSIGTFANVLPTFATLSLVFCHVFALGLVNPNAGALALLPFARNVGSASAIMGAIQMGSGVLASGVLSFLHSGTAVPMTAMMAMAALVSLSLVVTSHRGSRQPKSAGLL
jgi:DHA1 family bicyclomycin/chloramphenicol resistance-like MFS transporter